MYYECVHVFKKFISGHYNSCALRWSLEASMTSCSMHCQTLTRCSCKILCWYQIKWHLHQTWSKETTACKNDKISQGTTVGQHI